MYLQWHHLDFCEQRRGWRIDLFSSGVSPQAQSNYCRLKVYISPGKYIYTFHYSYKHNLLRILCSEYICEYACPYICQFTTKDDVVFSSFTFSYTFCYEDNRTIYWPYQSFPFCTSQVLTNIFFFHI